MAVNDRSIHDEDGDASDWIEINNPGTEVAFLDGWFLTDDPDDLTKWGFPAGIEVQPNAFRIVFASGKDRTNALGRLHTSFRLAREGEFLALVDPRTNMVSAFTPTYPEQSVDVSYGRDVADPNLVVYFPRPTPGERNVTGGPGFAPEVKFSRASGTFGINQPFLLTLSTPSSNAFIYYALGTNVPGIPYNSPVLISNSTIVRARSFQNGLLAGPVTSRTYLALASDVLNFSSDLPLMILHNFGQGEASMVNQYVAVQTFEPGLGRSALTNAPAQSERGRFHIRGITSSSAPKKPFFVELQDEFGADKESELLGLPEESDWALYAPYDYDPPMMHNPLAYEMMRDFGRYAPRTRYVELFLKDNSGAPGPVTAADYNGVYVLTEKIKRDNNRVAIDSLEPEHLNEPEITGGYILSIDQGQPHALTVDSRQYNWISPRGPEMTNVVRKPQVAYISNYIATITAVLNAPHWTNPVTGYHAYIDSDSWIDYHLQQLLTMNVDALRVSTYFHKPREGKLTFGPPWDFDRSQGTETDTFSFNPRKWHGWTTLFDMPPWWSRVFRDSDFWQKWIDRYQDLRQGPLSTNSVFDHIDLFANQLWEAQLRDQVRWGVRVRTGIVTNADFSYNFGSTPSYTNEILFQKFWYSNRFDFLDTNFLARPTISAAGGAVEPGFTVTVSAAAKAGTKLIYTLDGTDPRLSGGAISPSARSNSGPVTIVVSSNLCIGARSYNPGHSNGMGSRGPLLSSSWSGLSRASFYTSIPTLRITELMFHPEGDEAFEYVKVVNVGSDSLNLNGFKIRGGIEFDFSSLPLGPGAVVMVVASESHFRERYGNDSLVAGTYTGRLDNDGERIKLLGPCDEPILDFRYEDQWYPITDGFGFSLIVVDANAPLTNWNFQTQWRSSGTMQSSPVVVNEVLSRTEVPPPYDTLELHNLSDATVDISSWFLTDDFRSPRKYQVPANTVIPARGFVLFDEWNFNFGNFAGQPFSFSSLGDEVFVFSADANGELTGYFHGFEFGAQEAGVVFGRHINSAGEEQFTRQLEPSLGAVNAMPAVGPIVISEIMYHPTDLSYGTNVLDNSADEFIELHNTILEPVTLAHPDYPLNTWRLSGGVDFEFPPDIVLPGGGFLLVVNFDTANPALMDAFRSRYMIPASVPILGPYSGKLDNSDDRIVLCKPDEPRPSGPPDFGSVPYPVVESVNYSEDTPWPVAADGNGASLHRLGASAYGNDPTNWVAAAASPGRGYVGGSGPIISRQPADTEVVEYTTASLRADAAGAGRLVYQWRFNGNRIPGATYAELILTNIQSWQAGLYDVIVSDAANWIGSHAARLTVLDSVEIVQHPASQSVGAGSNVTFAAAAEGMPPITYQWKFNGTNLEGAHSASLILNNITNTHEGIYTVVVNNAVSSRVSNPAYLTVLIRPRMIVPFPPVRITATTNETITLGAQTIGTLPMYYRWRRISPSGGGLIISNAVENTRTHFATFSLRALATGTYTYTLILSNVVYPFLSIAQTNAFVTIVADLDRDGLPDVYENEHQFRPDDPADAGMDADGDGPTNLEEFLAGTDPSDSFSFLKIDAISAGPWPVIQFGAVSNRSYTLQHSDNPVGPFWHKVADFVPQPVNRTEIVSDPFAGTNRFYRITMPRQP